MKKPKYCHNCFHDCHCDNDDSECSDSDPAENGMGEIIPVYCGCKECVHHD